MCIFTRIIIILLLSFSSLFSSSANKIIKEYNKVLFISSYNASFPTINQQIKGIKEVLDDKTYQLDIEFMDTKRLSPNLVEPLFYKTLKMKQQFLRDYDVILVGDDNALRFVVKYQKDFFDKKPIVFFAINNISFAKEIVKNKYLTGVLEESSINETINLIKSLHPSENKIITVIDDTVTTKGIVNSFDKKISKELELLNISDYSFVEFEDKLQSIQDNEPILFVSAFRDKNAKRIEFYEAVDLIKNFTNSPIYHFYEHGIGEGLIGGKVVIFKEQGRSAAKVVKRIINGEDIKNIDLKGTENKYLFDYHELEKYKLLEKIPENSILINKPKHFLDQPIVNILLEIIFLFTCIFLWIIYLLYKLNKNSKELKSSYTDIQHIINSSVEGIIFSKNKICINSNTSALELLKYKKEDFIGKNIEDLFEESSLEKLRLSYDKEKTDSYEAELIDSTGTAIPFLVNERNIKLQNGKVRVSSIIDLREIKEKENFLQEKSKMVAIGEMIGNISHQWRQPLTVISSIVSGWKAYNELGILEKESMIEESETIIYNSQKLSSVIDDFMYFLKDENISTIFTIEELLNNLLRLENSSLEMNHIKLLMDVKSSLEINLNKNKLLQAFVNILNNSIEALSKNEEKNRFLLISAKEDDSNVIVSIVDNAGGVEDKMLDKIFEPYISTKDQLNGFGLGLYMTYTIINKMGARISIENKSFNLKDIEHKGLEITVSIPIVLK